MTYRKQDYAPQSQVAPERRGAVLGRFCHACSAVFSPHQAKHSGKGIYSGDHVSSPCPHEGELFGASAAWWEPAVSVLPAPPPPVAAPAAAAAPAKA